MAHRARLASCNVISSGYAIVQSSRAGNGCAVTTRAVAARRAQCLNSLTKRHTRGSLIAWSTRGVADSIGSRIIETGRTRDGRGHLRAVAKAAGGARQRAHGCAAAIRAITARGARKACGFERRAGCEARGGIHVRACRAAAIHAGVDGVEVAVVGTNIHGAISAKHGG